MSAADCASLALLAAAGALLATVDPAADEVPVVAPAPDFVDELQAATLTSSAPAATAAATVRPRSTATLFSYSVIRRACARRTDHAGGGGRRVGIGDTTSR